MAAGPGDLAGRFLQVRGDFPCLEPLTELRGDCKRRKKKKPETPGKFLIFFFFLIPIPGGFSCFSTSNVAMQSC